jgi:hypothetical protein
MARVHLLVWATEGFVEACWGSVLTRPGSHVISAAKMLRVATLCHFNGVAFWEVHAAMSAGQHDLRLSSA